MAEKEAKLSKEVVRSMVLGFRVLELHALLAFAEKSKSGKKGELQKRVLRLAATDDTKIIKKISELHSSLSKSGVVQGKIQTGNSDSATKRTKNDKIDNCRARSTEAEKTRISKSNLVSDTDRPRRSAALAASDTLRKNLAYRTNSIISSDDDESHDDDLESDKNNCSSSSTTVSENEAIPNKKSQTLVQQKSTPKKPSTKSNKPSNNTKNISKYPRKTYSNSRGKNNEIITSSSNYNNRTQNSGLGNLFATGTRNALFPSLGLSQALFGNIANFAATQHPPIQTAVPYMPYFPQAIKQSHLLYPTITDVKLRKLPFYDIMATLLKPSSLQPQGTAKFQEQNYSFHLTPQQVKDIVLSGCKDSKGKPTYKKQILVRFSLLETSCEQMDNFPSSICLKVNGRSQQLPNPIPTNKPGIEPKRPPKAINVTSLCKLSSTSSNSINVSWAVEVGRGYTVSVYLVEHLTAEDLLQKLKTKGQRHPDYTKAVIKDKLNDVDNEIATTSVKVSLACPLGKMRMNTPCRSSSCSHIQCFDAKFYIQMNEKNEKWTCPVCYLPARFDNLMIDGFFNELLSSKQLPKDENEIELHQDASWQLINLNSIERTKNSDQQGLNISFDGNSFVPVKLGTSKVNKQNNSFEIQSKPSSMSKDKAFECIDLLDDTTESDEVQVSSAFKKRSTKRRSNRFLESSDDESVITKRPKKRRSKQIVQSSDDESILIIDP